MKTFPLQSWLSNTNTVFKQESNKNTSFQDVFKKAVSEVNDLQIESDKKAIDFSLGNPNVNIHDVMISMEKAHLALQLTIEIRNKLVETYQEIMRMQV